LADVEKETLIDKLSEYGVFTYTFIPMYEMPHLYTPFEKITNCSTEESVRKAVERRELISLKGISGSGKTCVVQHVFLTPRVDCFPVVLSPIKEDIVTVCSSQEEFIRFMLSQMLEAVRQFTSVEKEIKELAKDALAQKISYVEGKNRKLSFRLGGLFSILPFLSSVQPELALDLGSFLQKSLEGKIYNTQRVQCIQRLSETIEEYGIMPVFFLDDTDKFLKHPEIDLSSVVPKFFGLIVPILSKLECPCIIATHPYYQQFEIYKQTEKNYFDCLVDIPEIEYEGLTRIVQKRIESVEEAPWTDVFSEGTMKLIYQRYKKNRRMRDPMSLCKACVDWASQNHVEKISELVLASVLVDDHQT